MRAIVIYHDGNGTLSSFKSVEYQNAEQLNDFLEAEEDVVCWLTKEQAKQLGELAVEETAHYDLSEADHDKGE